MATFIVNSNLSFAAFKIHVSPATKAILDKIGNFDLTERGEVAMKVGNSPASILNWTDVMPICDRQELVLTLTGQRCHGHLLAERRERKSDVNHHKVQHMRPTPVNTRRTIVRFTFIEFTMKNFEEITTGTLALQPFTPGWHSGDWT